MKYRLAISLCVFMWSLQLYAQPIGKAGLVKIIISDCWYGFGTPAEKHYEIDISKGYQLKDTTGKLLRIVQQTTIDSLIEALNDTGYYDLTLSSFGYSSSMLSYKAPDIAKKYRSFNSLSIKEQGLLMLQLQDSIKVAEAINDLYGYHWTDDYPALSVNFIYSNNDTITVSTLSQHPIMLPWRASGIFSYNPNVSILVSSVLPVNNVNAKRLSIATLEERIAQAVYYRYVQRKR